MALGGASNGSTHNFRFPSSLDDVVAAFDVCAARYARGAMQSGKRYYVLGPDSGGVYFLDVVGDELTHGGSGENAPTLGADEARELVSAYLLRFAGAAPGFEVLAALRADLDGEFRVGAWRVRFASGRALEAHIPWACADCGVGGHACTELCAGPLPVEDIVRDVQAMCGRPIAVARHGTADTPNSPWVADGYVIFDDTPKLTAPTGGITVRVNDRLDVVVARDASIADFATRAAAVLGLTRQPAEDWILATWEGVPISQRPFEETATWAQSFEHQTQLAVRLHRTEYCMHGSPAVEGHGFLCGWC